MNGIHLIASAPLLTAKAALDSSLPPRVHAYRIRWAWTKGRQTFTAVTTWVFPGSAEAALRNFRKRRPEAVTAKIEEAA